MSRKTRKLMWSAPLVAVLAVAGALAIFAMLAPNEASADERAGHGTPGPVSGLTAAPVADDTNTPEPEGRKAIMLTWKMPSSDAGDPAMSYRIDISENDARVWRNLEASVMDGDADMYCGSGAAANLRCYTSKSLTPGKTYYYRVFAVNEFGISPVSIDPTYDLAKTLDYETPDPVDMLTATTNLVDKIVLGWDAPEDDGGADVVLYCIDVAALDGSFTTLGDLSTVTCMNAASATDTSDAGAEYVSAIADLIANTDNTEDPAVIVIPATATMYEHMGLDKPSRISLRYRVYAVTDSDGSDSATTGRRIQMAASNTAIGRTVSALGEEEDQVIRPEKVRNLRAVAHVDDQGGNPTVHLFWNVPANYPEKAEEQAKWNVQVDIWADEDGITDGATDQKYEWLMLTGQQAPVGSVAQFYYVSNTGDVVEDLDDGKRRFRVLYVNDPDEGEGDAVTGNEIPGAWDDVTVSGTGERGTQALIMGRNEEVNLPQITETVISGTNANKAPGLRFARNENRPVTYIDLLWEREDNGEVPAKQPSAYYVDVSEDAGMSWHPLPNPTDLGATTRYTHKNVSPGKEYTYRVFPWHEHLYGLPAREDASSQEAALPAPVRRLNVEADGQTALKLTWSRVTNSGGHPVLGYQVQVGDDIDNDMDNDNTESGWAGLGISASGVQPDADEYDRLTVDKDTTMYPYRPVDATTRDPTLSAGDIRWFRVFAVTLENDGDPTTGGTARDVSNGDATPTAPSAGEGSPEPEDIEGFIPDYGQTELPPDPNAEVDPTAPAAPEDLTAEEAHDTNLPGAEDRGVLLIWNETSDMDSSHANRYVVQRRMAGATTWGTIGTINWLSMNTNERTSFTDPSEPGENEVREYRVGARGSAAVEPNYTDPIMYPASHSAHVPGAPTGVTATAMSATHITVAWTTPTDNRGSAVTGYTLQRAYMMADDTMSEWMDVTVANMGMDMMHVDMGLMSGTTYYYRVLAMNAAGNSEWSDGMAMAMTEEAADATLGDAMGLVGEVGSEGSTIELTWTVGDNADIHWVFGIHTSNDIDSLIWTKADASDSHTVDMTGKPRGSYTFFVIAGQTDDAGDAKWSDWTPGAVTY